MDPDILDAQEWENYRRHPARGEEVAELLRTLPPQVACLCVSGKAAVPGRRFRTR